MNSAQERLRRMLQIISLGGSVSEQVLLQAMADAEAAQSNTQPEAA